LTGMQERIALLGGRWRIESHPGDGTRVVAEVPASVSITETPASFRMGG
jgi:glucose-6-phosphate-specific signal transduction histidine kinase